MLEGWVRFPYGSLTLYCGSGQENLCACYLAHFSYISAMASTARTDILARRADIAGWIAERRSKAFICRQFNCRPITLENALSKLGLKYAGNQGGKGHKPSPRRQHATEFLVQGNSVRAHFLRLRLIEDGLKEHCCDRCGLTDWMGEPIPLQLHHRNGDKHDNRLENLLILCPNCHAQTPNYGGKALRQKPR